MTTRGERGAPNRGLQTPSLRRRVTWAVLAMITVMLIAVAGITDGVLSNRLDAQLRDRLTDRVAIADALVDEVDSSELVSRLEGDGISVRLVTGSGRTYQEGPLAGASSSQDATPQQPSGEKGHDEAGAKNGKGQPQATVVQNGDRLSVVRDLDHGATVTLLADASDIGRTISQVRVAFAIAAALVLIVAAIVVPPLVSRTLRPLEKITRTARSITAGERDQRLRPLQPSTELGQTAAAFDEMLDAVVGAESRAVDSEERLRAFLSDAAHDLRTPLAGVQSAAEHLLRDDPSGPAREKTTLGLLRETRRASRLVEDMLTMTRIDTGLDLHNEDVDLLVLSEEVIAAQTMQHLDLRFVVRGEHVSVQGDRDRLVRALANLVDNAVHASPAGGTVAVTAWSTGAHAGLTIEDDGLGVPPDQRDRIFERLVRLDQSRSSRRAGAGLGLSIALGIARAHGGTVEYRDRADGRRGAQFSLTLPTGG